MKPSINALQLIKNREQCKLTSYKLAGEKYYTIGYGHHCDGTHPWDKQLNRAGAKINQAQADELLMWNLNDKVEAIKSGIKVPIPQNLFDALVSMVYQYNPSNSYVKAIFRAINLGYPMDALANMFNTMPGVSFNKKARKADSILFTLGKVVNLQTLRV